MLAVEFIRRADINNTQSPRCANSHLGLVLCRGLSPNRVNNSIFELLMFKSPN
jgi:hypothetical protein